MAEKLPTFIKWAGGKSQLIEQFKPFFPKKIDRYFEPFVGSGAVFFYVKKHFDPKKILLSDINDELMNCFKVVRDDVDELILLLKQHKSYHSTQYYYEVRRKDPKKLLSVEAAARFIYLNKTCYNGLYRVNAKGQFNVPIGRYKNPAILDETTLREASSILKGVTVKTMPFEKIVDFVREGDFIYLDPPYYPLSKTSSFTSYTKFRFLKEEQEKLAEMFKKLDKRGCLLMLSNSAHPFISGLYEGYNIRVVRANRFISCNGKARGPINELVVMNYGK
jgi:DNA adenine methylase